MRSTLNLLRVCLATLSVVFVSRAARGAELPQPCSAGTCGVTGPTTWITSGSVAAALGDRTLTVTQSSDDAILNWQSFNISDDGTVTFQQPGAGSIALNRIYQSDPARIFGALNANGRVFLINQNGIVFGEGARVNVGGLVASTLDITPAAVETGIATAITRSNSPAFDRFVDAAGEPLVSGAIDIQAGARLETPESGQVLMFAPQIDNRGTILTPGGQTILGAGNRVYLASSTDENIRGLMIEVDALGDTHSAVTNGIPENATVDDIADAVGQIVAERGNVTLAGLAVNQRGRVSATTTVRQNGSIRLQAREGSGAFDNVNPIMTGRTGGRLTLGERSVTEVTLDVASTDTTVDANEQPRSQIELVGGLVELLEQSRTTATSGEITVKASTAQGDTTFSSAADLTPQDRDESRIYVATGATVDVAGASVEMPMERNVLRVELRGTQLSDNPAQRDGPLRGRTVYVDIRQTGTRADGTTWVGTPLADLSGDVSTMARSVAERSVTAGAVLLQSQGDTILAPGSRIDVSGGRITYRDGTIDVSRLLGADGVIYDIGSADPDRQYVGVASGYTRVHERWGVTETFARFPGISSGELEQGYVQGADAGAVRVVTPQGIFDGDIVGRVVAGRYQRAPAMPLSAGVSRPLDQVPRGAQLELGRTREGAPEFAMDSITFGAGSVLPTLLNESGLPFDPRTDLWPVSDTTLRLRPSLFGEDGIAEATLRSGTGIAIDATTLLRLADGGSLSLLAPQVEIDGSITAVGGRISATTALNLAAAPESATALRVGAGAQLDVRGRWVNDDYRVNPTPGALAPLHIDGGTVNLNARQGNLVLEAGSVIDVSAGAQRDVTGSLHAGHGGAISLSATPVVVPGDARGGSTSVTLGATLQGFALADGGSLSIVSSGVCIAELDCAGESETLWLTPSLFSSGGFSNYGVSSARDGLTVLSGTDLVLRQMNWQLRGDMSRVPGGADLSLLASLEILPDWLRQPTSLSLTSDVPAPNVGYTDDTFGEAPGLTIDRGAQIIADPGAAISLLANTTLAVNGSIRAPAGRVELALSPGLAVSGFLSAQAIRLGDGAAIDVSGVAQLSPNVLGRRQGEVLAGGQVSIDAARGYVVLDPASLIDVSGASEVLDLRPSATSADFAPTLVGSAGGSINIVASEGAFLYGQLDGHAGEGSAVAGRRSEGGSLRVVLDSSRRNDPNAATLAPSLFPIGERVISVQQDRDVITVGPGAPIPRDQNGRAAVAARSVSEGGFDSLYLDARPLAGNEALGRAVVVPGRIAFAGTVDLVLGARLTLDAARFDVSSAQARLAAPYVKLANLSTLVTPGLATHAGTGTLSVDAGFLELVGHTVLDGADATTLASTGDLRLRGVQQPDLLAAISGSLASSGKLLLRAEQVYATTLSQFEIAVRDNPAGLLRVEGSGTSRGDVLSAASSLRLSASTIEQAGVLRAPFGTIEMRADDLRLAPGNVTSTSAEGLTIPFGTTQGGFDWTYELTDDAGTLVYGVDGRVVPAQQVSLIAARTDIDSGALIDVSGGGDLLAYEFVPGVGGSRDVLSAAVRPDEFAIVPSLDLRVAAYDPREYTGSSLQPGDSIFLEDSPGVPVGEYTLLPARYALLPGAFLIRATNGASDFPVDETPQRFDGATVVSGYRTLANTAIGDSRRSAFAVRPAALALREAEYTTTSADAFFSTQAAEREVSAPRLPRDAGVLTLTASDQLRIDGDLRAAVRSLGRGAAVDVSSARLRITNGAALPTTPGEVVVDANSLSRLGVETLLLGGRRTETELGVRLDAAASQVTIAAGAHVTAPELLVTAKDSVVVEAGATLEAAAGGESPRPLLVTGDSGVLRVASGEQGELVRSAETGLGGVVDVRDGATLRAAGGSVLLDATLNTMLNGSLDIAAGSLNLGAPQIRLGDNAASVGGLTLSARDLTGLGLSELVLTSRSPVELNGDVNLDLQRFIIDAAGLTAGVPGTDFDIGVSESLVLRNSAGLQATASIADSAVNLTAERIEIGRGAFLLDGFSRSTLTATEDLFFDDGADLRIGGDLDVAVGRLTAAGGAVAKMGATGVVSLVAAPATPASLQPVEELGATLSLTGSRISSAGSIVLPAGRVDLRATGSLAADGVTLNAGAVIDVRGRTRIFDGVEAAAPGGEVNIAAAAGGLRVDAGAVVDVRGSAEGGDAGSISLIAGRGSVDLIGELLGSAVEGNQGGSLSIDAASFGGFDALASYIAQGFNESISLRQRGPGDLLIGSGTVLRARDVDITVEQGALAVSGTIDATGPAGGHVSLTGRDSVSLDGSILAAASSADQRGGTVELLSESDLHFGPAAVVDVTGGGSAVGGTVLARLPRSTALTAADADSANDGLTWRGKVVGARGVTVEGFQAYVDDVLSGADLAAAAGRYADAQAFMASAATIRAALGRDGDSTFSLLPGIEIRSTGDLTLAADWNLFPWRFEGGTLPGILTLRAGGNLLLNNSLSDGFSAVTGAAAGLLPDTPRRSWSYRLVGGADLGSANPLSVLPADAVAAGSGSVRVAAGNATVTRAVRTGTGSIDIRAATDFVLGNQQSVVYTAGAAGPGIRFGTGSGTLGQRAYPINGGDLSIEVGRDITGALNNQLVTDWLWRVGTQPATAGAAGSAVAWTVNYQRFQQNVATLGGGDLRIRAGRNISDFSASIPSIGRQVGGTSFASSVVEVGGGGNLDLRAGGSIRGGSYYVGRGEASLVAGDSLAAGGFLFAPILALQDGSFAVTARRDLAIEAMVNPTLLPQATSQAAVLNRSYYGTYSPDASARLLAVAGDVLLDDHAAAVFQRYNSMPVLATNVLLATRVAPPTLSATSLSGDIVLDETTLLYPGPKGNLDLLAYENVRRSDQPGRLTIGLPDTDLGLLPSIAHPAAGNSALQLLDPSAVPRAGTHSPLPLHADGSQPDGVPDTTVPRIVAVNGDVDFTARADVASVYFAKPVRVIAGRDLIDVPLTVQHLRDSDVSVMTAGRDLRYTVGRTSIGQLAPNTRQVAVDGPGLLQVTAGRDFDLQTSLGFVTRGNLNNPFLPETGASVSVLAGVTQPAYAAFVERYLGAESEYLPLLVEYVERVMAPASVTPTQAREQFALLDETRQRPFIEVVLAAELRASGRAAAKSGNNDFTRAFAALETLFPGSNPDVEAGEDNLYVGDVRLFFSRLYTLAGGDITVIAPGGEINVGLATPPAAFGISKAPSDLGIVAQQTGNVAAVSYDDFAVNESRVFAADGGDILVWATRGDIDAGRGAKTAISAPPPTVTIGPDGQIRVAFPAALTGSGIQTLATSEGKKPGNVDLFAPRGVVNAGDAGIVAGNLTIAATAVLGADNISVSGVAVGVPVDTGGLGAALTGVSAVASSAASAAEDTVASSRNAEETATPLADQALSFLDVVITGFGDPDQDDDDKKENEGD
jgi:filamentous hemagglutinin family protein